jgi:hypothetical protein
LSNGTDLWINGEWVGYDGQVLGPALEFVFCFCYRENYLGMQVLKSSSSLVMQPAAQEVKEIDNKAEDGPFVKSLVAETLI